jgi:Peptidase family M1 domain
MKTSANIYTLGLLLSFFSLPAMAQSYRWQQAVNYTMNVTLNTKLHTFEGSQNLVYTNNSPDTLKRVFYHLYFNAFQPKSMMDTRSRAIQDPDRRVKARILNLLPEETGRLEVVDLTQDRMPLKYSMQGTILVVELAKPILPHTSTTFDLKFLGQVPIQIRRSGRNNKEGIDYSMAQWYPKICEYDEQGWHPEPYVAREFYGVWGRFDVSITIDADYVVAASGILQNPEEIGFGYEQPGTKVKKKKKEITYHFVAENVHDFMWAADPDYVHKTVQVPDGPKMHYFYVEDDKTMETWPQLMEISPKMVSFMNQRFGKYAYSDFYVIQGGDGGMEYPMSTLIVGRGKIDGLVSVTMHEMLHSWYQGALGTNESLYPWMDEGFTSYAQAMTKQYLYGLENPLAGRYKRYLALVESGLQEPLTTHADHYATNSAYGAAAYSMGSLVPYQLAYIMGQGTFDKAFRDYYYRWQFRHPTPADFEKIMEKHSGMVLDWFFLDWLGTIKHLNYAINKVTAKEEHVNIELINKDQRPMPIELLITFKNGKQERYYIPLRMMRGEKVFTDNIKTTILPDWPWTNPTYLLQIKARLIDISKMELDPEHGMVDIDYTDNTWLNQTINNE